MGRKHLALLVRPQSLGYKFCAVEQDGMSFRVRSDGCLRTALPDGSPCTNCEAVTWKVSQLARLASEAKVHTRHALLTHEQLRELLRARDTLIQSMKLQV